MAETVEDLIARGIELMALENYEAAKQTFSRALEIDRRNVEAHIDFGNACACLNQIDEAISAFKTVLLIDEENIDALYSMGCAYFVKSDYANALRYFNQVEAAGGATVEMYDIMTSMFLESEDAEMAVRCINRAIALAPLNGGLRVQKAQVYAALGQLDDAIATLQELQEVLPDEAAGYSAEVEVQIEAGHFDKALEALDRALSRFPADPGLYALKARALNTLGRYEEAAACAQQGLDLGCGNPAVSSELAVQKGVALGGLGKLDESIEAIEASVEAGDTERADALFIMMNECLILKEDEKALDAADRLLAMEDAEPRIRAAALFYKPFALERLGKVEEAHELYVEASGELRRITIAHPGLFEIHGYRVLCHKALGEFDEALSLADHLIALDPQDAAAYAMKRDVCIAMGDDDAANKLRAKILSLNPDYDFGA